MRSGNIIPEGLPGPRAPVTVRVRDRNRDREREKKNPNREKSPRLSQPSKSEVKKAASTFDVPATGEKVFAHVPRKIVLGLDQLKIRGLKREKSLVFCDCIRGRRKKQKRPSGKTLTVEEAKSNGVRLHSQVIRRLLADSNDVTKNLLIEQQLVVEFASYQVGEKSKGYWFHESVDPSRIAHIEITDRHLIEKLRTWKSDRIIRNLKRSKSPVYEHQLLDLGRITLSLAGKDILDDRIKELGKHTSTLPTIRRRFVRGYGGWFNRMDNGRLSTHITGCPSDVRDELLIDGKPIVEWDIPSSHVAILASLFSDDDKKSEEFREIVQLLQTRMFYEAFRAYWLVDNDGTKSEKVLMQKIINDHRWTRIRLPFFKALNEDLPLFMRTLLRLKQSHRRKGELSNLIQGKEATLLHRVVSELHSDGIPCFTCYDSIGVPLSAAIVARDIFNRHLEQFLGFRLCVKTDSKRMEQPYGPRLEDSRLYPPVWEIAA